MNASDRPGWRRRWVVYVPAALLAVPLLWSLITTPTVLGHISIPFEWDRVTGFKSIHTVGHLSRLVDPPYDRWLSNPLIVVQARPLISSILRKGGWQSAKGRLDVRVFCSVLVLGIDRLSDSSFIEHSRVTDSRQSVSASSGGTLQQEEVVFGKNRCLNRFQTSWICVITASTR
jgi:hypothetical protein